MNKSTHTLESSECVGDWVGKINFNSISLNSKICQLSATFFSDDSNFFEIFNAFSERYPKLNYIANYFAQPASYRESYTATNMLSAYWEQKEISIQYPINFVQDINNNIKVFYLDGVVQNHTLVQTGLNYLNLNFPPTDFSDRSIIKINFLLYSNSGNFTTSISGPYTNYPVSASWSVNFGKNDVYVTRSKEYKYKLLNQKWTNFE